MIQTLLVKAIILFILIFVWKKVKKPSEKIATVRKSSIITKTVKRDSEKLLFEYRVVEVDALWFAQKVKSNIKLWNKTKGNKVISKAHGLGQIIDVTQSENNILLITIIFNGEQLLTNTDSFIDGYFKTIFISDKLLTDLVIQNEEIITFPIEDNKPNAVVADKKLADAKIATDKAAADKKLADAKIATDKAAADKKLVDAKIATDKAAADKKLADAKIATDKAAADKKLADAKIAADKAIADKKLADTKIAADKVVADKILADAKITDDYEVSAVDFAKYADKNIEIWSEVEGATVKHSTHGTGKILHIKQRKNYIPLIHLIFNDEGVVMFNSDSFKSGNITTITVSKKIHSLLEIWSQNLQNEEYYKTYYKNDWRYFENILREYNIESLYHFTDSSNIASIKEHGGLYSWWTANEKGIFIPKSGGDDLSKSLDERYNLEDYVRLSFTQNHPMMYVAQKNGCILNPIILKIDPQIIFWKDTIFSDMNATKNNHSHGKEFNDFKRIKFDVVTKQSQFDIPEIDKPYYQAEVMVRKFIPICFILGGL